MFTRAAILAAMASTASAFMSGPAMPMVKSSRAAATTSVTMQQKSAAIPFLDRPPKLDGTAVGDIGFDPLWVSSMLPDEGYFKFLQEAEIKHGRVAMLAAAGAIAQDLFTFPGTVATFGNIKMTGAHDAILAMEGKGKNVATFHQMLLWLGILEIASAFATIQMFKGDTGRIPGDFAFDPLGMGKKDLATMQLKEIKNGRLAMIGIGGMVHHYILTGKGPLEFLGGIPNYKSCVDHPATALPFLYNQVVGPVLPKIC